MRKNPVETSLVEVQRCVESFLEPDSNRPRLNVGLAFFEQMRAHGRGRRNLQPSNSNPCCLLADLANGIDFISDINARENNGWFLLGLLNSNAADFAFKIRTSKYRGGCYSATPKFLELIPIPILPDEIIEYFVSTGELEEFLENCVETNSLSGWQEKQKEFDGIRLKAYQFQSIIYLSKKLFSLCNLKQEEQDGFLSWLSNWIGVSVFNLDGITKIQNYSSRSFDDLIMSLKKNKNKIMRNLSSRESYDQLKDEYNKSYQKIQPLNHQIEIADRMVNLLFYSMYGLNTVDIAVVEEIEEDEVRKRYMIQPS